MDTFFGSLAHLFATANITHIIWCAVILAIMLTLAVLHHRWKSDPKKIRVWRLLCLLPMILCIVHEVVYVYGISEFIPSFIPLYLIAVLALIPIPFVKRKIGYRIAASFTGVLSLFAALYFCATSPNYFNHIHESYTGSFHSLIQDMDRTYVLKEWKEVDFSALETKYMPLVQEAEREQNPAKFFEAVESFCFEMHDEHINVSFGYDPDIYMSELDRKTHEYGLAMIRLDNGDVIAICTTEEVNAVGIEDGTIITSWNGKPIAQALSEDVQDHGEPVKANADRLAPLWLSGTGGETVDVSFLDRSGNEQTVTLADLDRTPARREAFANLRGVDYPFDFEKLIEENFSTKMLDDKCGYLKLTEEETGSYIHDTLGVMTGDHKWARDMFREKLNELKAQGMEYLVIDLRNNMGGFDEIGCALCDLLTDKDWYGQGLGIRQDGKYICLSDHCIHGTGEFADLKVVALTNYCCASAGDGTALYLSRLPNVTLAGITDPCGINQKTGGISVLSGLDVTVFYPTGLVLDENRVPNVDTRADRISRNPVEVRIPLDFDAAMRIFRDKEDYELDWAIKYLEELMIADFWKINISSYESFCISKSKTLTTALCILRSLQKARTMKSKLLRQT